MDKFEHDYAILKDAVSSIDSASSKKELAAIDAKIGAALHALQYGVGVMAIEIKKKVDARGATL